jgi:NADPH-dependent 2,4-dienoyl-CoA reductase/sulfur reductase-like enzyme
MEAARVAALRGHDVTLVEKRDRLGGTLRFSALVYPENGALAQWLETQVRKLPIDLRLNQDATPALIEALAPEVVLVAVGARHADSALPGADRREVFSGRDLRALLSGDDSSVAARKLGVGQRTVLGIGRLLGATRSVDLTRALSRHWLPLGRRVVVVGGGLVGVELAEFLCDRGRQVAVLEDSETFAAQMAPPRRWRSLGHLRSMGVELHSQVSVHAIDDAGVHFTDAAGEHHIAPADSVLLAADTRGDPAGVDRLAGLAPEVHAIGDCSGVGYIEGAMLEGARAARQI